MTNTINNGLKQARINKNLSISELASAINKDVSTIRLWESGLKTIDYFVLLQLSNILECPIEMLLFGETRESLKIDDLPYEQQKEIYDLAMLLRQSYKEDKNGLR